MRSKVELSSRRKFFRTGLTAAGSLVAGSFLSHSLAMACGISTGEQPLGPFFPRPNTPFDPIREDMDPGIPIHLANDNDLTFVKGRSGTAKGQIVYVHGQVTDENCNPVQGASLVVWQASASGRYNHKGDSANQDFVHPVTGVTVKRKHDPSFQYWGRTETDSEGRYQFKTIVPGFYPADLQNGWYRPPHIHFLVSATGFPQLVTQSYFRGSEIKDNAWIQELNERDFLLQNRELTNEQRESLIVDFSRVSDIRFSDGLVGQFDIRLSR